MLKIFRSKEMFETNIFRFIHGPCDLLHSGSYSYVGSENNNCY